MTGSTPSFSVDGDYRFRIHSPYQPAGDQPQAIASLVEGIHAGLSHQTLLGVTGSGKTFTIANVLEQLQRPAIIMAHNKTLAAQLYREFKDFFPDNAVEYFVSYYDYYQPEAYVPSSDTYIEKDSSVNEHIEQMRLSATKSLLERPDVLIVATVSAIYGLGAPEQYMQMLLHLSVGEMIDQRAILLRLAELQYQRNDLQFIRGTYRVRGDLIDVYPADSDKAAVRIELFDNQVDRLSYFDPLTGHVIAKLARITIYPKSHYVTSRDTVLDAADQIKIELKQRLEQLTQLNKLVEKQRLEQRTIFDLEMIRELGYCTGIENYSRYLSGRESGNPPPTLFDYLPSNALMIIDESHVTVPQIGAMYKGDRSRKETLVEYGFRLPSALDNRPLQFEEWEAIGPQCIFVSATPSHYEAQYSGQVVEQLVRPTWITDPNIEVRPARSQIDDLIEEIAIVTAKGYRILVTTLTKRMAEDLTEFLNEHNVKVRYLHSDIGTVERVEIIRDLRMGIFDVLIGINLLREGLDMPEVALVAILDADKEGFLRSDKALIQTIGRAARHIEGRAILYGDNITGSMQRAIDETQRRQKTQQEFNTKHNKKPTKMNKAVNDILDIGDAIPGSKKGTSSQSKVAELPANYVIPQSVDELARDIRQTEKAMQKSSENLDFEEAAELRDRLAQLKSMFGQT